MLEVLKVLKRRRRMILSEIYAIKSGTIRLHAVGSIEFMRGGSKLASLEKELKEVEELISYHSKESA